MNNNNRGNNGNNRRRGRSGNNRQQGNGQSVNRIDSRARGNAPQMLEKYRKMAHDAHLNGDRVQEEYCLQFADHYFRVIADQRQRQEEQRAQRMEAGDVPRGDGYRGDAYRDEASDYSVDGEASPYDPAGYGQRDDRGGRDNHSPRDDRGGRDNHRDRDDRNARDSYRDESGHAGDYSAEPAASSQPSRDIQAEPNDNPFLRSQRQPRESRDFQRGDNRGPRRDNRRDDRGDAPRDMQHEMPQDSQREPRQEERRPRGRPRAAAPQAEMPLGLDPSSLPPAISASRMEEEPAAVADTVEVVKPVRRTRRARPADDAGEALESVS